MAFSDPDSFLPVSFAMNVLYDFILSPDCVAHVELSDVVDFKTLQVVVLSKGYS